MEKTTTISLENCAYHEAAHAVAHIAIKLKFKKVTIVPDEEEGNLGSIHHRAVTGRIVELMSHRRLLDYALISFAAPAQDEYRYGSYDLEACSQDIKHGLAYIEKADFFNMQALYDETWERARKFVRKPLYQKRIERVAQALLVHDTLTYDQVLNLYHIRDG